MEEEYWEKCRDFESGKCPERSRLILERVYLIPHLLDASEIEAAKEACNCCKRKERRNSQRINRPFAVVLTNQQPNTRFKGTVINVSESGALIRLNNSTHFRKGDVVELRIYSNDKTSGRSKSMVLTGSGVIQRELRKTQELAIMFIDTADDDP